MDWYEQIKKEHERLDSGTYWTTRTRFLTKDSDKYREVWKRAHEDHYISWVKLTEEIFGKRVTTPTLRFWYQSRGWTLPPERRSRYEDNWDEIVKMVKEGNPYQKIADELGLNRSRIQGMCHERGITTETRVTKKEVDYWKKLYHEDGILVSQIVEMVGYGETTVRRHLKLGKKFKKMTEEETQQVYDLYDQGCYTYKQIGEIVGYAESTIYQKIKKYKKQNDNSRKK